MEILVFELSGQRYALYLSDVREILHAVAVTRLPGAPAVVEGVVDVRGTLTPVLDLRRRFGLAPKAIDPAEHMIHASAGRRAVLMRADRALGIVSVEASAIDDARTVVAHAEHVAGVARLPDGLVLIHDLQTFLSEAESDALDRVLASPVSTGAAES